MKTILKLSMILLAMMMQATTVFADGNGGKPVRAYTRTPKVGNNAGPKRAPAKPTLLYIDITLNEDARCLELFDTEGSNITYYIYNEDDDEVAFGEISFENQEEATISLASLEAGLYYLEIIVDGTSYEGEFGLED